MKQFPIQSKFNPARMLALACVLTLGGPSPQIMAAVNTWTGTTNGTWDTATPNWSGTTFTSGNDALFTGTPTNNVTTATGLTIGAITLDNTFTGSVTMTGANIVNGATTISGGTLNLTNATGLGSSVVTVNSGGTLGLAASTAADITFNNTVAGAGKVQFLYNATGGHDIFLNNLAGFTGTIELSLASGSASTAGKARLGGATLSGSSSLIIDNGTQLYMGSGNATLAGIQVQGTGNTENRGAIRFQIGTLTSPISLMGNTTFGTEGATLPSGSPISAGSSGLKTLTLGGSADASGGSLTINSVISDGSGQVALSQLNTGTLTLSGSSTYSGGTTISAGTLSVGNSSALGTGTVAMSGGNLSVTTGVTLANNFTLNNGATFTAGSGTLALNGSITGSPNGSLTLTPTNKITLGGSNSLTMSANSAGMLVNAGAGGVDITGTTTINGNSAGNNGYLNMMGTVTLTVQSGGAFTFNGTTTTPPTAIIGQNTAGTSTLLVNGGALTVGANTAIALGNNIATAIGVLTVSSGTATINRGSTTATDARSFIMLGKDTSTGTINLNGGVLATDRNFVRDGSGTADGSGAANFNFGGGTLKALANQTDWLNSSTKNTNQLALSSVTTTGTSTIDANGFSVAINNVISGSGGFNVNSSTGTGVVTFGGANTYSGGTTISSGTLAVLASGSISGSLVLGTSSGSTGTLDVTAKSSFSEGNISGNGTINIGSGKTVTATGNVSPGFSAGTLTVSDNFTLASTAATALEINGSGVGQFDVINTGGTFTYGGTLTVTSLGGYDLSQRATYDLFTAGTFSNTADFTSVIVNGVSLTANTGIWTGTDPSGNSYTFTDATGVVAVVPEPSSWAMLVSGIGLLNFWQRTRRRQG